MDESMEDLLGHYQAIRSFGKNFNNKLMALLSKQDLEEGGRKLGLWKKGTLVLGSEDEMSILADYCIHDVRRRGVNAVDRYLAAKNPSPDSEEGKLLKSLQEAWFSFFMVESVKPGLGVTLHDLIRNESHFLHDMGLSSTAFPGMLLVSRVMQIDGITMTTGAAIPMGAVSSERQMAMIEEMARALSQETIVHSKALAISGSQSKRSHTATLSTLAIRCGLESGATEHVHYADTPSPRESRVRRNDACSCGSGRKFRKCCGSKKLALPKGSSIPVSQHQA